MQLGATIFTDLFHRCFKTAIKIVDQDNSNLLASLLPTLSLSFMLFSKKPQEQLEERAKQGIHLPSPPLIPTYSFSHSTTATLLWALLILMYWASLKDFSLIKQLSLENQLSKHWAKTLWYSCEQVKLAYFY